MGVSIISAAVRPDVGANFYWHQKMRTKKHFLQTKRSTMAAFEVDFNILPAYSKVQSNVNGGL